jgi:resuscitation-promoting factor RpfA
MRSGTGRHRRPRQAPLLFVTAGVTGAGFAMPLLAASGAQAADTATWDRVAECESGGVWSTNDDNGYYGGLQFTLSTWEKYGGTVYAERPDLASRSQQIAIAEKILTEEGPEAWPTCAIPSGLTEDSTEKPEINLGEVSELTPTLAPGQSASKSSEELRAGRNADRPEYGDRSEYGDGDYLVRSGDSLSSIAAHQELNGGWAEIYAANESVIGGDPDLILPGQRLDLG